jgi:hypothetical protein
MTSGAAYYDPLELIRAPPLMAQIASHKETSSI